MQSTCPTAQPSKKRRPKARTKRWDNPVQNVNSESEEEEDESIQNDENKETEAEMNLDMIEDTKGKESVQYMTIIQKESRTEKHTDPAQGGAKRPHESSNSNKEQTFVGTLPNEECQLTIVSPANAGWIQVKPKKGKKGRLVT